MSLDTFDNIVITPDAGRFVSALMAKLLTSDEIKTMSLTGGVCAANSKRNIVQKRRVPPEIVSAIIGRLQIFNS